MAAPNKLRPYTLRPPVDDQNMGNFLDWVQNTLNTLIGQQVPSNPGIRALSPGSVDPTSNVLLTGGSRTSSLATGFTFTATTTTITIYWDGSNSSAQLRIYRDDGSVAGPFPGTKIITGLVANTKYFFYPYFDEATQTVKFVSVPGAVGSPPIAYLATDIAVAQQQILRGRIPLATSLAITGVMTPAAGTTPATKLGGSGGSVGARLAEGL